MASFHAEKVDILGSKISIFDLSETADLLQKCIQNKNRGYVCVSNVHTVVSGAQSSEFKEVTNKALLATPDGLPLTWVSKFLHENPIHGRASGPDIMELLFKDPKFSKIKHGFYGSTDQVLGALKINLKEKYPHLNDPVFLSAPFFKIKKPHEVLDANELAECQRINQYDIDILWVGLGAPKQEIWMARFYSHLKPTLLVGVGAAFDFLSGNKKRAPLFLQKLGLEWLHRLCSEPRRLFVRYFSTNPKFIVLVLRQYWITRILKRNI